MDQVIPLMGKPKATNTNAEFALSVFKTRWLHQKLHHLANVLVQ